MSSTLLKSFLQDDVDSFKRLLANTSNAQAAQRPAGGTVSPKVGSSSIGSSPSFSSRTRKITGTSPGTSVSERGSLLRGPASRAQVNARDRHGRTLLHLIASSSKPTAIEFANALLALHFVDIYAQDVESGWTALHRALYAGNAAIAHSLMARDVRDATDFSTPSANNHSSGGLIKVKDREGNSPFDVYEATIVTRDIKHMVSMHDPTIPDGPDSDASSVNRSTYGDDDGEDGGLSRTILRPRVNLLGDEVFTFGSNKNLTLGLGDEDDRHFPERIAVERPDHLLQRFHRERKSGDHEISASQDFSRPNDLPTLITNKSVVFQDVVMSKLHTAIVTNDPESNLFMCGFGPGGRLGTGDEVTRFSFVCIETGGLAGKKIISTALGQDHSIAISEQGEIFTWGSNKYGQLGYNLPRTSNKKDTPVQSTPRQIFNPFKREVILGAAASSIHSVVFSTSGLYTFGKNEGQLGLVDSDARSLDVQVTPRRVGVSLFNSPIQMVSAIDKATTVLLESHDVWVFTQYGYSKVVFPLDFGSSFIKESFLATRYGGAANRITKVTSGRNTICAMSSFGEVYTVQVHSKADTGSSASSTTNPAKIRNSLSSPERVWSVRKSHMAVRDVDVGQDGSIIICTTSGSAWRKEKRIKIKEAGSKDYKFVRIPGVARVIAVRSNAFGAYAVAQRECDVAREQITISPSSLWHDFFQLLPFKDLAKMTSDHLPMMSEEISECMLGSTNVVQVARIKAAVMSSPDIEDQIRPLLDEPVLLGSNPQGIAWIKSTLSEVRIPVHEFVMSGRSTVLRMALAEFRQSYYFSIPDFMAIEYDQRGHVQIVFQGVDFLSILNLAFFLYTDCVLDVWREVKHSSVKAFRYRQIRTEVMRIATHLDLQTLERAARVLAEPSPTLNVDIGRAMTDLSFLESGDVTIHLKGETVRAHSHLLCQRCPFFDGLFHGRSGGRWLDSRRDDETISVDLKDIDPKVFDFVLRHLYGDTEEGLFQDVRCSLDDFIDLILDVMSVANELMIDRLAQICQKILGQFVNTRNVCHLLNAVAPCTVTEFKEAALEYICLNLEVMLENRLLNDLDEEMLYELDVICQENQLARYPVSRGRNSEEFMLEKYPELVASVEVDRQRRVDAMKLRSRFDQDELQYEKIRAATVDKLLSTPTGRRTKPPQSNDMKLPVTSPVLKAKHSTTDLMFHMDDEGTKSPTPLRLGERSTQSPSADGVGDDQQAPFPSLAFSQGHSIGEPSLFERNMGSIDGDGIGSSSARSIATTPKFNANSPLPSAPNAKVAPWGSPVISGEKRELKDIMVETSQSRISNLTLGMSARPNAQTAGSFTQKLSQKERKKIQQQQTQDSLATQQKTNDSRQSPWRTVANKSTLAPQDSLVDTPFSDPAKATPSKPSMTLRQTVAGAQSMRPLPGSGPPHNQGRIVSQPLPTSPRPGLSAQTTPKSQASPKLSPTPAQPIIQSIRHTPRPERSRASFTGPSSGQASLASILLQQQTEKDEIREAATAKHNLQDIQLEQEFQEWWEMESKRVMQEAEAAASAATAKEGKGRRGNKNRGQHRKNQPHEPSPDHGRPESAPAGRKGDQRPIPGSSAGDIQTNEAQHRGRGRPRPSKGKERVQT